MESGDFLQSSVAEVTRLPDERPPDGGQRLLKVADGILAPSDSSAEKEGAVYRHTRILQ